MTPHGCWCQIGANKINRVLTLFESIVYRDVRVDEVSTRGVNGCHMVVSVSIKGCINNGLSCGFGPGWTDCAH